MVDALNNQSFFKKKTQTNENEQTSGFAQIQKYFAHIQKQEKEKAHLQIYPRKIKMQRPNNFFVQ